MNCTKESFFIPSLFSVALIKYFCTRASKSKNSASLINFCRKKIKRETKDSFAFFILFVFSLPCISYHYTQVFVNFVLTSIQSNLVNNWTYHVTPSLWRSYLMCSAPLQDSTQPLPLISPEYSQTVLFPQNFNETLTKFDCNFSHKQPVRQLMHYHCSHYAVFPGKFQVSCHHLHQ